MSSLINRLSKNQPTIYKAFFKSHKIPLNRVSRELGTSYPYFVDILNGNRPLQSHLKERLDSFVSEIEQAGGAA